MEDYIELGACWPAKLASQQVRSMLLFNHNKVSVRVETHSSIPWPPQKNKNREGWCLILSNLESPPALMAR